MPNRKDRERVIAIGDVHGEYRLLKRLVEEEIRFDPRRDRLVFLGDYIDRGPQSRETVDYVSRLREGHRRSVVLLLGNHEDLARRSLTSDDLKTHAAWLMNGGHTTVQSYGGFVPCRQTLMPFFRTLDRYYENETHIFVHAGLLPDKSPAQTPDEVLLWSRQITPHRSGKEVVVGHTIQDAVSQTGGVVCVDTGAFMSGVLSAYDTVSRKVYSVKAEA